MPVTRLADVRTEHIEEDREEDGEENREEDEVRSGADGGVGGGSADRLNKVHFPHPSHLDGKSVKACTRLVIGIVVNTCYCLVCVLFLYFLPFVVLNYVLTVTYLTL